MLMPAKVDSRLNYWWFFVPFSIAALLGFAGILAGELFMLNNAGGAAGRDALYRYLGTASTSWFCIAIWGFVGLRRQRSANN